MTTKRNSKKNKDELGEKADAFEHALKRPDYVLSSIVTEEVKQWVCEEDQLKALHIVKKKINYNHGLVQIVVETISNAIDSKWRKSSSKEKLKRIEIGIDTETGTVSIYNDGPHIPVKKQPFEFKNRTLNEITKVKLYPAQIYFGEMLAGTNFDDDTEKKSSGRNGIGAKLGNIFSTEFTIEHTDPINKKKLTQTYSNNGTVRQDPIIEPWDGKGWVRVTFKPDLKRFSYPSLDEAFVSCIRKKACDCALITGVPVYFIVDGEKTRVHISDLKKYATLYDTELEPNETVEITAPQDDECLVMDISQSVSVSKTVKEPNQISFVNGVQTVLGGKHVTAWTELVLPLLRTKLNERKFKKGQELRCTVKDLYPYLRFFVRAEITPRPQFDGQVKAKMVSPNVVLCPSKQPDTVAGWKDRLNTFVEQMLKWPFVEKLDESLAFRKDKNQTVKTIKARPGSFNNKHCQDAGTAGEKDNDAVLLICEGDSAMALAKSGVDQMKAHATIGILAVRGKFRNSRKCTRAVLSRNKEVRMIMGMFGLDFNKTYKTQAERNTLRYRGGVRLFTDADDDGIHIRGLLMSLIHQYWPILFKHDLVTSMSTPVCMVTAGKKCSPFYSMEEFREAGKKGAVRYLKGLGSSVKKDAKLYFSEPKVVTFTPSTNKKEDRDAMNLGFLGEDSDLRKPWITKCLHPPPEDTHRAVDFEEEDHHEIPPYKYEGVVYIVEFINDNFIIYTLTALKRAIPCMYDSFKEASRKVFFTAMLEGRKNLLDMERFVGSVKKETRYHHASSSMHNVIIGMAQRYVGSNNAPLLEEGGMFGTREHGGKDYAAPRYLATRREEFVEKMYRGEDEILYERLIEDNEKVEYKMYIPIVATILVEGAAGMACGFATNIPGHDMLEVIANQRRWINGERMKKLVPSYRGYTGKIKIYKDKGGLFWSCPSVVTKKSKYKYILEETQVGVWNQKVDEQLRELAGQKAEIEALKYGKSPKAKAKAKSKKKKEIVIESIELAGSIDHRKWIITLKSDVTEQTIKSLTGEVKKGPFSFLYRRQSYMNLNNMYVLDENGYPRRYAKATNLLKDFCSYRLKMYEKRKVLMLEEMRRKLCLASNRYKFVKAVVDEKLVLYSKKDADETRVEKEMEELGLERVCVGVEKEPSYKYLLSMPIGSSMKNKLDKLKKEKGKLKSDITKLEETSEKEIWLSELDELEVAYKKFDKENPIE